MNPQRARSIASKFVVVGSVLLHILALALGFTLFMNMAHIGEVKSLVVHLI
jgi:hypothetical protein